ncbi:MAG: MMPL family transporter [Bacteroidota bacterium]
MSRNIRILSITTFLLLGIISVFYLFRLQFSFDFEQFFPTDDPDLEYFKEFTEDFETDDSFMLIAAQREEGVFEQNFLEEFQRLSLEVKKLPYYVESQSLTQISYPIKTPFGLTAIPAIHIDDPSKYESDKKRILQDERFLYNLISEDATTMVIAMKIKESITLEESEEFMTALDEMMLGYNFENHYFLGRPYFQKELVDMQKREVMVSAGVSGILVSIIMFWIFRRPYGIITALFSIGLGMLVFMGILGMTGRELNAMSALYPVLMIIVGTSDVIHIMSKYIDELKKGLSRKEAIKITIKEIGLATLLTSTTTAIGFASLLSSQIKPIRDFGINSAIGVLVAYVTVICFTTAVLSFFQKEQIIKLGRGEAFWTNWMSNFNAFTKKYPRQIAFGGLGLIVFCLVGISQVTTNYNITSNMPRGEKITEDFNYFQNNLTSFRPMEIAVEAQGDYKVNDYEVLREIDQVEQHLKKYEPIRAIASNTLVYKSINQMNNANRVEAYEFPESKARFASYKKLADRIPEISTAILESKDKKKARITSRIADIGADTIQGIGTEIDTWVAMNTDSTIATFQRTGTGLIIDKNAEYVRRSLLLGLGGAMMIVSLLMVLLFRDLKMLVISLLPNLIPLLLAGALLGYLNIELEAGVAIVFAVIFGIAVDDTIHFLSKFKLARNKGKTVEEALLITFTETGKAIALTTIILFFGFLVMLFSIHPPSVVIGMLISVTLFSALFSDLLFIPLLIRWMMRDK